MSNSAADIGIEYRVAIAGLKSDKCQLQTQLEKAREDARRCKSGLALYGIVLSSWHNRPDCFDGWETLFRMRKEFDAVVAGSDVHFDEWMADPNGKFLDDIQEPNTDR